MKPDTARIWGRAAVSIGLCALLLPAQACEVEVASRVKRVGSVIELTTRTCPQAATRLMEVRFAPQAGLAARTVGRGVQSLDDAPTGGAEIADWDQDGQHEIAVTDACAGPNCDIQILRVDRTDWRLRQVFRGLGDLPSLQQGLLLQEGRDSCCARYIHVYRFGPAALGHLVDAAPSFSILAETDDERTGQRGRVTCRYHRPSGDGHRLVTHAVAPTVKDWIRHCALHGQRNALLPRQDRAAGQRPDTFVQALDGVDASTELPDTFGVGGCAVGARPTGR